MSRRSRIGREMARLARVLAIRPAADVIDSPRLDRNTASGGSPALIFRSEMEFISSCILDHPEEETGGQLFGYWTKEGTAVVLYAIGPGERANHQRAFFNQDMGYLVEIGRTLHDRYGLCHIGEWHSHHTLGLAHPSGHDIHTMVSTIREKELGSFLLCIGNCSASGSTLNPFLCDARGCRDCSWDVIMADSPVRSMVDREQRGLVVLPSHQPKCMDPVIASETQVVFPKGYWLEIRENREAFNGFVQHIREGYRSCVYSVTPKIDAWGIAHIVVEGRGAGSIVVEDIVFPEGFPLLRGPEVSMTMDGRRVGCTCSGWDADADIQFAFIKFFCSIKPDR